MPPVDKCGRGRLSRPAAAGLILALLLAMGGALAFAQPIPSSAELNRTVAYLIDSVAASDVVFIRNGKSYGSREAAKHMKDKYDYFKKEIKTAEDFIRLAASKSELSGQPYLVRMKDGTEMESADWLRKILNAYRASQGV